MTGLRSCVQNRLTAYVELSPVPFLNMEWLQRSPDGLVCVWVRYEVLNNDTENPFDMPLGP